MRWGNLVERSIKSENTPDIYLLQGQKTLLLSAQQGNDLTMYNIDNELNAACNNNSFTTVEIGRQQEKDVHLE